MFPGMTAYTVLTTHITSANYHTVPPHTGQAEARMGTFEPTISRGTKSLVRKRPELQAPFEQRRAIMDAKRQERERLRQAARVGRRTKWAGGKACKTETGARIAHLDHARHALRRTLLVC